MKYYAFFSALLLASSTAGAEGPPPSAPFAWTPAAKSPVERVEAPALVLNDKLYVFGGFDAGLRALPFLDVYDPAKDSWTRLHDMPMKVTHLNPASDGKRVWFAGGFKGPHPGAATDEVWKYDVASDSWSPGPPLPERRAAGALVRLGKNLHYFGGYTADRNTTCADHWTLSLDDGKQWKRAAALPEPKGHVSAIVLHDKIYALGGRLRHDTDPQDMKSCDAYDPATDKWSAIASLPFNRSHFECSTFLMNGRIVIAGGISDNTPAGTPGVADVTLYDPAGDSWVALPALPQRLLSPVAALIGDKLIVSTGGLNNSQPVQTTTYVGTLVNRWEVADPMPAALGAVACGIVGDKLYVVGDGQAATLAYHLTTGKWMAAASQPARAFAGRQHAAEVVGGKLYLLGGIGGDSEGKTQIFDPKEGRWTTGANMPFAAGACASAVLGDEIYVAGGTVKDAVTSQAARYSPKNNTWTLLPAMKQGVRGAAGGTDGSTFYVFGGIGPEGTALGAVQVYDPASGAWRLTSNSGAKIAPLPQARGGMGKAVFVDGEFYLIGGRIADGEGAKETATSNRVDVYHPGKNTWRSGTAMPTARQGVYPQVIAGRIYVAGGGPQAGPSTSPVLEIYNPSPAAPHTGLSP